MKAVRTFCTIALLTCVASPVFAAVGTKKPAPPKNTIAYYKTIDKALQPVTLTDDQTTKLEALKKDYQQKFDDAYAKTDVLTPEQKKAGNEARTAAKADGKKGKELTQAVADAEKETDEQKAKAKDARKELTALRETVPRQSIRPAHHRAEAADRGRQAEEGRQARESGQAPCACRVG